MVRSTSRRPKPVAQFASSPVSGTYYDFYFFTRNFGDRLVQSESSDPLVTVYASSFTGGGIGIAVVNEAADSRTLALEITGASLTGEANVRILSGPDMEGPEVSVNATANAYGTGGPLIESVTPYTLETDASGTTLDVPRGA